MALAFAALGHPRRVEIFESLLAHADSGQNFGELQQQTRMPASTLTHHVRELERGGVLIRTVQGRTTNLRLDLKHLQNTLTQLMSQCCSAIESPNS